MRVNASVLSIQLLNYSIFCPSLFCNFLYEIGCCIVTFFKSGRFEFKNSSGSLKCSAGVE